MRLFIVLAVGPTDCLEQKMEMAQNETFLYRQN